MAKTKTASKPRVTGKSAPEPDNKPGETELVRQLLIGNELATVDEIKSQLAERGHPVAPSTISAVKFHTLSTLRVLRFYGAIEGSAEEQATGCGGN